jgi:hypothetical protein
MAALDALASGQTLSDFCRQPGRPDRRTITRWVAADPVLQQRFAEARRIGHDVIAESTLALADAPFPVGADGRIDPALVQQRRLQVDTRLRLLAKWDTARYGDKVQMRGSGPGMEPSGPAMTDEQCAMQIEALLALARSRQDAARARALTTRAAGAGKHVELMAQSHDPSTAGVTP